MSEPVHAGPIFGSPIPVRVGEVEDLGRFQFCDLVSTGEGGGAPLRGASMATTGLTLRPLPPRPEPINMGRWSP
jgi:hypothetical protein